jgi:hypothetical protein
MAGIGGLFTTLMGSKNQFKATPTEIDRNNYNYGNTPGGADEAAGRYRGQAEGAQGRQGVQVDFSQADQDRGMAMGARDLSLASRDDERGIAAMMAARARGDVPSIAGMRANEDIRQLQQGAALQSQQAVQQQASAQAGARGAAGMALAGQGAANNVAQAQGAIGRGTSMAMQGISNQAQINAANERMQAEQGAMGAYGQVRGGDMAMRGQDMTSQGMSANQAMGQAGFDDAQRGRNDAMTMGMTANEIAVRNAQMQGGQNYEGQRSANDMTSQGINAGVSGQNAGMNQKNAEGAIGMLRDAAGGVGSLFKAHGGPVQGTQPYLVGEYGPELIVPAQDGHVIPARETRDVVGRMFGGPVMGVDIGGAGGITGDMVKAASTGRMTGGIAGMVGGGGITGGGGAPGGFGGFSSRAEGGPVSGVEPTWARSTMGGTTPDYAAQARAYAAMENFNAAQAAPPPSRFANAPLSGGLAVAGFTPGIRMSPTEPLDRRDMETAKLADAKRAYGVQMSGREEFEAEGAERRSAQAQENEASKRGEAKAKKDDKPKEAPERKSFGTIDAMIKAGVPEYKPMGSGYTPPQLLPMMRRAGGGEVEGALPLYEPPGQQLHQTDDGHAFLAMAPSQERPLAGGGLASMSADPVVARVPVSKKSAQAPAKKQSEEEIRRAAKMLEEQMRGEWGARMSAGPAIGRMR